MRFFINHNQERGKTSEMRAWDSREAYFVSGAALVRPMFLNACEAGVRFGARYLARGGGF